MDKTIKRNSKFQIKFILIFSLFLFFLFSLPKVAFSQECTQANEGETRPCNDCGIQICECVQQNGNISCSWSECQGEGVCCTENGFFRGTDYICDTKYKTQYKCEGTNCGDDILKRNCHKNRYCSGNSADCTGNWSSWICGSPSLFEDCESWQKCKDGTEWTDTQDQVCQCEGECLDKPENPRYYSNPNFSDVPEKNLGNENLFLPIKLDWDDIPGWRKKGGPTSYVIEIENTTKNTFSQTLTKSEFIPPEPCLLKSGEKHIWRVKGCCNSDGTNCGTESEWTFTTNLAPEPYAPKDPDWAGPQEKKEETLSTELKWCKTENEDFYEPLQDGYFPRIYKILIFQEGECHPFQKQGEECLPFQLTNNLSPGLLSPEPVFSNKDYPYFTKDTSYSWKVSACKDLAGIECTPYSQEWKFSLKEEIIIKTPSLLSPPNDFHGKHPVGLPVSLNWTEPFGARSFEVEIYENNQRIHRKIVFAPPLILDSPTLSLNTLYKWRVRSCWDEEGENCEPDWSGFYFFKTTGEPPILLNPANNTSLHLPIEFKWSEVPGVNSYVFEVLKNGETIVNKISSEPLLFLTYPEIKQGISYLWHVRSCAKPLGKICGSWSSTFQFTVSRLPPPTLSLPKDKDNIPLFQTPFLLKWQPLSGIKFYKYRVIFLKKDEAEKNEECKTGKEIEGITKNFSVYLPLKCLGEYEWQVVGCFDEKCTEIGDWSKKQTFSITQKITSSEKRGLVPCNLPYDIPDTPWDEREKCEIKHLFILINNILNFLLWKIAPIVIILLLGTSGLLFYFASLSGGNVELIYRIKKWWKVIIIGYILIFGSWLIVSYTLLLFGYRVGIFGEWWKI